MFSHRRLADLDRSSLLRAVLDDIQRSRNGRPSVAVFDLDGTLMDNRPRMVAILRELAEYWDARHPEAALRCRGADPNHIVYGFEENLRRLGISDEELHREGFAFWKERFFSDPHVRHDVGIPGAREFVRACYERGATIIYLTGRDLPNMALGSFASLRDLGFPIGVVGTELVVKPHFDIPDADFKRSVAPILSRIGRVSCVFDNEPANCNIFLDAHPDCISVFVDTQYAPNPPKLHEGAHVIHTFEMDGL